MAYHWYYRQGNTVKGPISETGLRHLLSRGRLEMGDMVRPHDGQWMSVADYQAVSGQVHLDEHDPERSLDQAIDRWKYRRDGRIAGEVTPEEMAHMMRTGYLAPDDWVWHRDCGWTQVHAVGSMPSDLPPEEPAINTEPPASTEPVPLPAGAAEPLQEIEVADRRSELLDQIRERNARYRRSALGPAISLVVLALCMLVVHQVWKAYAPNLRSRFDFQQQLRRDEPDNQAGPEAVPATTQATRQPATRPVVPTTTPVKPETRPVVVATQPVVVEPVPATRPVVVAPGDTFTARRAELTTRRRELMVALGREEASLAESRRELTLLENPEPGTRLENDLELFQFRQSMREKNRDRIEQARRLVEGRQQGVDQLRKEVLANERLIEKLPPAVQP